MILFAAMLSSLAMGPAPAWMQRAVQPPIVAWREADVLGTPIVEGIAVNRDAFFDTLTVNVVDSRYNPPEIVDLGDVKGSKVRWLRAGTRDGLYRIEIAIDVVDKGRETAYLLRVPRRGLTLELVRSRHGTNIAPNVFSR